MNRGRGNSGWLIILKNHHKKNLILLGTMSLANEMTIPLDFVSLQRFWVGTGATFSVLIFVDFEQVKKDKNSVGYIFGVRKLYKKKLDIF